MVVDDERAVASAFGKLPHKTELRPRPGVDDYKRGRVVGLGRWRGVEVTQRRVASDLGEKVGKRTGVPKLDRAVGIEVLERAGEGQARTHRVPVGLEVGGDCDRRGVGKPGGGIGCRDVRGVVGHAVVP